MLPKCGILSAFPLFVLESFFTFVKNMMYCQYKPNNNVPRY